MSPAVKLTDSSSTRIVTAFAIVGAFVTVLDSTVWAGQRDLIRHTRAVHGRYIVGVRAAADPDALAAMSQGLGRGHVRHVYRNGLRGFAIEASEASARAIASDPAVAYVEEDAVVTTAMEQSLTEDGTWGLDRIDQRAIAGDSPAGYDHVYRYSAEGTRVNVYVLDTGIRTTHVDFGGRAFLAFNARPYEPDADCAGHGTHVAGIAGGATYGVAKSVTLHSVRVLGCDGAGYVSDLVAGIDWTTAHAVRPAVINMSIQAARSAAFDDSAQAALAAGIAFVAAAGNDSADACAGLVGGVPGIVVVGASNFGDQRAGFSNFGKCVDLFAPGDFIISALPWSDVDRGAMSGTSMASPHVAGAAALYLQGKPQASPAQVAAALVAGATPGVILDAGAETPNRLLFTPHFGDATPPVATVVEPTQGATVRGLQSVRVVADDDIEMAAVTVFACGSPIASDRLAPSSVSWDTTGSPEGDCAIMVEARDLAGNVGTARASVVVRNGSDAATPQLTLWTDRERLWPANGRLVPVTFTGTVTSPGPDVTTVSFRVTDDYGLVQPRGAAAVTEGHFQVTVYLEAQRNGRDRDGRRYVMTVNATDGSGHQATASAQAFVSHDSGARWSDEH